MVLVEKRAHLVLEISLAMVRLLPVDIPNQRTKIGGANGKQTVPALPRKSADTLLFHPGGRAGFNLGDNLCRRSCRGQSHRKMNVVSDASCSETLAIQFARGSRKIPVKSRQNVILDQRDAIFGTEDDMNQIEAQRLRHCCDYMSGLQPSTAPANTYLGLRPRLVCHRTYGPHCISAWNVWQHIVQTARRHIVQSTRQHIVQTLSAKGATTYQPGAKPQDNMEQKPQGLKARHIT
jgi:hypothetical protein